MATRKADLEDAFALPAAKPRTPVEEGKAAGFVVPKPKGKGASKLRREGPGTRVNAYIPTELEAGLRRVAFEERRSLSDALTEAIAQWLKRKSTRVQE